VRDVDQGDVLRGYTLADVGDYKPGNVCRRCGTLIDFRNDLCTECSRLAYNEMREERRMEQKLENHRRWKEVHGQK
jgi:hypothetical protein